MSRLMNSAMNRSMKHTDSSLFASLIKIAMVFLFALLCLFIVGYLLANHVNDADHLSRLPEKNNPLFILWRSIIYSAVILLSTPVVRMWCEQLFYLPMNTSHKKLLHYRKMIIVNVVVYELLIVQNLFKVVVQWGYYYVGG